MLGYYLLLGVIAAAGILFASYLPQPAAGVSLVIAAILVAVVDRVTPAIGKPQRSPRTRFQVGYLLAVAGLLVVSIVLVWTVVREAQLYWLGWFLAALLFGVIIAGVRVFKGAPSSLEASH